MLAERTMTTKTDQNSALSLTTLAFTICFAVWTIFAIIGVQIKQDMGLSDTQFSLLIGTPILDRLLVRLFFGIWADQYGGRPIFMAVMLSPFFTWCLTYADTYEMMLLTALGVGVSGGSFVVGISYLSKWYDKASGNGAGRLWYGEYWRCRHQVYRALCHGVLWLAYGCASLGDCPDCYGGSILVFTKDEPQIQAQRAAQRPRQIHVGIFKAPQETAGLAFFALLFLCLWRLCGFGAVAAPLLCRRLRHGY
jgi:MFS family permease